MGTDRPIPRTLLGDRVEIFVGEFEAKQTAARMFDQAIAASGRSNDEVAEYIGVDADTVRRMRSMEIADLDVAPTLTQLIRLDPASGVEVARLLLETSAQTNAAKLHIETFGFPPDPLPVTPLTREDRLRMLEHDVAVVFALKSEGLARPSMPTDGRDLPLSLFLDSEDHAHPDVWMTHELTSTVMTSSPDEPPPTREHAERYARFWTGRFMAAAGSALLRTASMLARMWEFDEVTKRNTLSFLGDRLSWHLRRILLHSTLESTQWNLAHAAEELRISGGTPAVIREIKALGLQPQHDAARVAHKVRKGGHRTRTARKNPLEGA